MRTNQMELRSRLLFELDIELEEPQQLGRTPHGARSIYYLKGGHFEGSRVKGQILPGGGDWLLSRSDDVKELDIRITLQTDDGHLIYVIGRGLLDSSSYHAEATADEPYMRSVYYFETAAEQYSWLNRIVAVVVYVMAPVFRARVYEIL